MIPSKSESAVDPTLLRDTLMAIWSDLPILTAANLAILISLVPLPAVQLVGLPELGPLLVGITTGATVGVVSPAVDRVMGIRAPARPHRPIFQRAYAGSAIGLPIGVAASATLLALGFQSAAPVGYAIAWANGLLFVTLVLIAPAALGSALRGDRISVAWRKAPKAMASSPISVVAWFSCTVVLTSAYLFLSSVISVLALPMPLAVLYSSLHTTGSSSGNAANVRPLVAPK